MTFGRVTVKQELNSGRVTCECSCGIVFQSRRNSLIRGKSTSCGCKRTQTLRRIKPTHGMSGSAEYQIWASMLKRCRNPKCTVFRYYGGRGIRVCDRWLDFANFIADMGPRPTPQHSIDRIDGDQGYSPDNCRWATKMEQSVNTRSCKQITFRGVRMSRTQIAMLLGMNPACLRGRIQRWGIDAAIRRSDAEYTRRQEAASQNEMASLSN